MKTMMADFRPGKQRLRATFAAADLGGAQRFGNIDAEKGVLHDVQINVMGEAKGHGVWLGEDFIDGVVEQGNLAKNGVKSRFGHPAMCSDALGTFLGRAKNFTKKELTRTDGSKVFGAFADFHLAEEAKKAPGGDLYSWTLETAKNNPDTFGQSIVFSYANWYVLDADGNKRLWTDQEGYDSDDQDVRRAAFDSWMETSADGKIYAVLDKLLGTDFTDSPAATDGVFGADSLAETATQMLDEHPQIVELLAQKPEVATQFLARYNEHLKALGKPAVELRVSADEAPAGEIASLTAAFEKRLSGLQAAKDKEISELREALGAQKSDLEGQLSKAKADLDEAKASLSIATEAKEKAEQALAKKGEQLEAKTQALAKLTGDVLIDQQADYSSWQEAVNALGYAKARRQCPMLWQGALEN